MDGSFDLFARIVYALNEIQLSLNGSPRLLPSKVTASSRKQQ